MDNVKTGFQSSEFYVTIATTIIGVLSMAGLIEPGQHNQLVQTVSQIIGGIMTLVPAIVYIWQRTWLKSRSMPIMPTV